MVVGRVGHPRPRYKAILGLLPFYQYNTVRHRRTGAFTLDERYLAISSTPTAFPVEGMDECVHAPTLAPSASSGSPFGASCPCAPHASPHDPTPYAIIFRNGVNRRLRLPLEHGNQ